MAESKVFNQSGGGVQCYAWHAPGGTLPERKVMAEGRREELLTLLYQEEISSDQLQELVREWIDLVMERDKLLHEELQNETREEKEEYLRDLRMFLNHIPLAELSFEERQLKDCLRMLERQVTNYCNSHNIDITRPQMEAWHAEPNGLEGESNYHPCPMSPECALDVNKENRTQTHSVSPVHVRDSDIDGPGTTRKSRSVPVSSLLLLQKPGSPGHSHSVPGTAVMVDAAAQPNYPPPPPSTLPPAPPPPPPLPPILGGGAAKAVGTVQFVNRTMYNQQKLQTPTAKRGPHKMERSFLDEIATVGQTKLRSTKRPRSPGGTPLIKTTAPSTNDKIQQALLNRIKNLQSTPIRHQSKDLSNQWSDVNSFEDPDLTTGDVTPGISQVSSPNISQGFSPSSSRISTPKPGKGGASSSGAGKKSGRGIGKKKKAVKGDGVSPNASRVSTAV